MKEHKKEHQIKEAASYRDIIGSKETKRSAKYKQSILRPKLYDSVYMIRRSKIRVMTKLAGDLLEPGLAVGLDVGCGTNAYKSLFSRFTDDFFGIDIATTPYIDVKGDIKQLPFKSASIDLITCNMTIEHVRNYESLINEIWRALKPGGVLMIDLPLMMELHGEEDFWRFTKHSAKYLFKKFKILSVAPCGGFFITWGGMLCKFIDRLLARKWMKILGYLLFPAINLTSLFFEGIMVRLFANTERGRRILDSYYYPFTVNNVAVVQKERNRSGRSD